MSQYYFKKNQVKYQLKRIFSNLVSFSNLNKFMKMISLDEYLLSFLQLSYLFLSPRIMQKELDMTLSH